MVQGRSRKMEFAAAYVAEPNGNKTLAALNAGYAKSGAWKTAERLLKDPEVIAEIRRLQDERSQRVDISADKVLEMWWAEANFDPVEISQLRRVCCRYCHGKAHRYQYKQSEWDELLAKAESSGSGAPPPKRGGVGFNESARPHSKCPECHGEGVEKVFTADSRDLTKAQRRMISSIKQLRGGGVEIKFREPGRALENAARHLGMFVEKVDINVKYGLADRLAKARKRVHGESAGARPVDEEGAE